MIWDFKRALYCAAQAVSLESGLELGDPGTKSRIQGYFDSIACYPPEGDPSEFVVYFEKVYPDRNDRRRYILRSARSGRPSNGYKIMSALIRTDRIRVVWSTNRDDLLGEMVAQLYSTSGKIGLASFGNRAELAVQAIKEGWPVVCKIYGDYQVGQLTNTIPEQWTHNESMRLAMIDYSGFIARAAPFCPV